MSIVVNGATTITAVTVNGSPISSVNVNGTNVFNSEVIYNPVPIKTAGDQVNYNILRQVNGYLSLSPDNNYTADILTSQQYSPHSGMIFKDFSYMEINVTKLGGTYCSCSYGTCTKTATLPSLTEYGDGLITAHHIDVYTSGYRHIVVTCDPAVEDIFIIYSYSPSTPSGYVRFLTDGTGKRSY